MIKIAMDESKQKTTEETNDSRLQPETPAAAKGNNSEGCTKDTAAGGDLEDLFVTLKQQISSSDWLEKNTAEKWVADNPQLAKDYMEASKKT